MKEIPIDQILEAMEKPTTASNISALLDGLKQVNTVLGEFQKSVKMLDNMGLLPLLVRVAGVKCGVDAETPLKTGFKSETHAKYMEAVNALSEEELKKQLGAAANVQTAKP